MKKCHALLWTALAAFTLNGCILKTKVTEWGRTAPLTEAEWNAEGIWKKRDEKLFVPVGYTGPVNEASGEFISDKRDGKRLFVPKGGANGYKASILRNDAYKSTGGRPK